MYDKPIAMIENVSVDIIARLCAQTCTRNCYALRGEKKTELKKKECNRCGTGWTDERTREDRTSQSMDTGRLSFAIPWPFLALPLKSSYSYI